MLSVESQHAIPDIIERMARSMAEMTKPDFSDYHGEAIYNMLHPVWYKKTRRDNEFDGSEFKNEGEVFVHYLQKRILDISSGQVVLNAGVERQGNFSCWSGGDVFCKLVKGDEYIFVRINEAGVFFEKKQ